MNRQCGFSRSQAPAWSRVLRGISGSGRSCWEGHMKLSQKSVLDANRGMIVRHIAANPPLAKGGFAFDSTQSRFPLGISFHLTILRHSLSRHLPGDTRGRGKEDWRSAVACRRMPFALTDGGHSPRYGLELPLPHSTSHHLPE